MMFLMESNEVRANICNVGSVVQLHLFVVVVVVVCVCFFFFAMPLTLVFFRRLKTGLAVLQIVGF